MPQIRTPATFKAKLWLDCATTTFQRTLIWTLSFALFVGNCALFGGATTADDGVNMYPAWMLAHGAFSCAYVTPGPFSTYPLAAPVFSVLSAVTQFVTRIGTSPRFPLAQLSAHHCAHAYQVLGAWLLNGSIARESLGEGVLVWLIVAAGAVSVVRTTALSKTHWESLTLLVLALSPPLAIAITQYFHPQDIVAMGFLLWTIASWRREHYLSTGVFAMLALLSQQNVIVALVLLLIHWPLRTWGRLIVGGVATFVTIIVPLTLLCGTQVIRAATQGTGLSDAAAGGTWMAELQLSNSTDLFLSRVLPILGVALVALWWFRHRVLSRDPFLLLNLLALGFSLRLLFEENFWGYYTIGIAVTWLLSDILRRRLRLDVVAWLAVALVASDIISGSWYSPSLLVNLPIWVFQLVLLPTAVLISLVPLVRAVRESAVHVE